MNNQIKALMTELESIGSNRAQVEVKLQEAWNKVFDDSKALAKAISNAQDASMYQFDRNGEVESWYRFSGLSDFQECRDYFENWLSDRHCMRVDWENELLLNPQGESIIIQDDARNDNDNGVWFAGKCIIDESEYKTDDEVDESKRNALIEAWMEKNGHFPGVFRTNQHDDVFPVNTQKKIKED